MIRASILNHGIASGPTLVLMAPLSFWGAFDPRTGMIVDTHHPQRGACLAGHILLLPETRGSGGTPGGIAEAIRRGTGPLGIILMKADINLAIGAATAAALYQRHCPVLQVNHQDYSALVLRPTLAISADGTIA